MMKAWQFALPLPARSGGRAGIRINWRVRCQLALSETHGTNGYEAGVKRIVRDTPPLAGTTSVCSRSLPSALATTR